MGSVDSRNSFRCHAKKSLRTPTTFWCGIATVGPDVTFRFQPIKRGVHSANRYLSFRADLDFLPHSDPISSIIQPQKSKDNEVLEFAKEITIRHYLYIIEQMIQTIGCPNSKI